MGGGTVHLPEGVYGIASPLIVPSNVRLKGDGRGRSVLRSTGRSLGKIVNGTGVWAAVATVAADGASITDLTVDLSAAGTHANGVALLPSGSAFEGPPSTNCEIARIEVIGGGNYHAYMIWNLRGRGIRIVDNVVDGRIMSRSDSSNQEGIESYGGTDVFVGRNVVRNIGNTALNFGSAGLPDTGVERLEVIGNVVTNSGRGLNIGPWMASSGPQNVLGIRIVDNIFADLWRTGIFVSVQPGTAIRNLIISGNTIANVGDSGVVGAAGIHFQGTPPTASLPAGAAIDTLVSQNQIENVRGNNAIGILVAYYPDLSLVGNRISDVGAVGVQMYASAETTISGNSITRTQQSGLISRGPSSLFVRDNVFEDWGQMVAAVSIDGATFGDVLNNVFRHQAITGSAVRVEAGAANVTVFGNRLFSAGSSAEPFVNVGSLSNLGAFDAAAGTMSVMVESALATTASNILVEQTDRTTSTILAVKAGTGSFQVTFDTPLLADATFRYSIGP